MAAGELAHPPRRSLRALARVLDGAVFAYVMIVLAVELEGWFRADDEPGRAGVAWEVTGSRLSALVVLLVASFLYEVVPTAVAGRTLGKLLLGMRVVRDDRVAASPGLVRAMGRWLPIAAALSVPVVGPVVAVAALGWGLVDPRGRGWHDHLAGTWVVNDGFRGR